MKRLIAANWKENKTTVEALEFVRILKSKELPDAEIIICSPHISLTKLAKEVAGTQIRICSQDVSQYPSGAYTGEVGAFMLKDYCDFVLIGHSERRKFFGETNSIVNNKLKLSLEHGIRIILCIGETAREKAIGMANKVLDVQLNEGLTGITAEQMKQIIIAYEPVWAISSGDSKHEPATPNDAETAHQFIRKVISEKFDKDVAEKLRIIYGGSIKPSNAKDYKLKDIDGALVGSASLDVESFYEICIS